MRCIHGGILCSRYCPGLLVIVSHEVLHGRILCSRWWTKDTVAVVTWTNRGLGLSSIQNQVKERDICIHKAIAQA
jgi:hypothetical protein